MAIQEQKYQKEYQEFIMASIKKINETLIQINTFIEEENSALKQDPNNFAKKLTLANLESQLKDLQHQLYSENLKRHKEIVELRFIGNVAKFGSIPLAIVGDLTNAFSKAIFETSKYFQFGKKGGLKVDNIINETIDLRLENIGTGSTIFYLSAQTSPDLFGNSIIQNSLDHAFELLNSENANQIIENIPMVGSKSIKYYSNFFKELNDDKLALDITWHTPEEKVKVWNGTKDKILTLYNTLNRVELNEPEEVDFTGEIITLSLKGKFEIKISPREYYYGTYPNILVDDIKQFHVGDFCKGVILKTKIYSPATEKEKFEYLLKNIQPA